MAHESATVKQGDTLLLSYSTRPKEDMNNWTCRVMVKVEPSDAVPLIDITLNTVSADTFSIIGNLDTTPLTPGSYWVLAQLDNAGTSQSKEVHNQLIIETQGVF